MAPRQFTVNMPSNPLLQVVYFLLGGILLIGAFIMGAVVLAVVLGIAVIAGLVIWVRLWWLRRKILKAAGADGADGGFTRTTSRSASKSGGRVIEVEYRVVDEHSTDRSPDRTDRDGDRRD